MKKMYIIVLVFFTASVNLYSQFGSVGAIDAKSMSLAKTYNATTEGIYSIGINPANLMFKENNSLDFSTLLPFPQLSLRSGSNFLSLDEINYFFGGVDGKARYLNEDDKKRFNELFDDGGNVFANVHINLLSASYKVNPDIGAFGFSINDFMGGEFNFPKALVELALNGNQSNKTFLLQDEEFKSWWIRNYSVSYARDISTKWQTIFDKLSAGVSFKYVQGFYYIGSERVNTEIYTDERSVITGKADLLAYTAFSPNLGVNYDFSDVENEANISPFMEAAGTGVGFDLGFAASIDDQIRLSLSITDIGNITWSKNTAEFISTGEIYIDDITNEDQIDSLEDKITGKSQFTGNISTPLATTIRLGGSYYFPGDVLIPGSLLLAFDYNQGLNNMPGNSVVPRFSIGAEWKPMDWVPYIRTGFSFGGVEKFGWAFGIGVDAGIVEFNLATSDMNSFLVPNAAESISIAFGSRWKF